MDTAVSSALNERLADTCMFIEEDTLLFIHKI